MLSAKKNFPRWIQFDQSKMEGKVIASITREDVGIHVDPQLVVEAYSR